MGLFATGCVDNVFDRCAVNTAVHPVFGHFCGGVVPDLFVLGDKITLGKSFSKCGINPVTKVLLFFFFKQKTAYEIFDVFIDTEEKVVFREIRKTVFKGIFDVFLFVVDFGIAVPGVAVFREDVLHERKDLGVPGEDDV